jgi:hypothetical protein
MAAGRTVNPQLFLTVKVAALACVAKEATRRKMTQLDGAMLILVCARKCLVSSVAQPQSIRIYRLPRRRRCQYVVMKLKLHEYLDYILPPVW